jgi:ferritin-like metal-binding protein YciE
MVHELKDLYSAERQLVRALPRMSKNANSDQLRTAIDEHLAETEEQVTRIETILESFGEKAGRKKCEGMEGLIEESKSFLEEDADPDVLDAGIIVAAQKVEHYEIAAYGAVCEYARIMGHTDALKLLQQTLEEEKKADERLNSLAEGGINALAERDNGAGADEMQGNGSAVRRPAAKNGRSRSRK